MQSAPQPVSFSMQPDDAKDRGMSAPPYTTYPVAATAAFPARQPRDYVTWSLFNFAFLNACCLGFMALVFSFKARDRKVVGDVEGAASYGHTAKSLNIAALLLSILFVVLFIVLLATGVIAMQQLTYQMENEHRDYFQRNGK
ncbi:PREDICTED: dispanin subfamily A member 2b-like [Gekko japonicus]|uniref:Dispanin subfamily A member 2b-like n=1 Tax=Gekko japonicus TaxID=146911 RepID=A0ABM1K6S4_GEKJA|nr:PREDICTED: dispanin subfamily A member 2b-like [Gekko japonicus]